MSRVKWTQLLVHLSTDDHNGMDQAAKTQSVVDSATLPALKLCLLGQFQLPHYLYTWILLFLLLQPFPIESKGIRLKKLQEEGYSWCDIQKQSKR
uniref:Uncharacterized protein n=1 Tax=Triticum urartu TaxID=4572 RepID=A0A8R7UAF6_TRIUA